MNFLQSDAMYQLMVIVNLAMTVLLLYAVCLFIVLGHKGVKALNLYIQRNAAVPATPASAPILPVSEPEVTTESTTETV